MLWYEQSQSHDVLVQYNKDVVQKAYDNYIELGEKADDLIDEMHEKLNAEYRGKEIGHLWWKKTLETDDDIISHVSTVHKSYSFIAYEEFIKTDEEKSELFLRTYEESTRVVHEGPLLFGEWYDQKCLRACYINEAKDVKKALSASTDNQIICSPNIVKFVEEYLNEL